MSYSAFLSIKKKRRKKIDDLWPIRNRTRSTNNGRYKARLACTSTEPTTIDEKNKMKIAYGHCVEDVK